MCNNTIDVGSTDMEQSVLVFLVINMILVLIAMH